MNFQFNSILSSFCLCPPPRVPGRIVARLVYSITLQSTSRLCSLPSLLHSSSISIIYTACCHTGPLALHSLTRVTSPFCLLAGLSNVFVDGWRGMLKEVGQGQRVQSLQGHFQQWQRQLKVQYFWCLSPRNEVVARKIVQKFRHFRWILQCHQMGTQIL